MKRLALVLLTLITTSCDTRSKATFVYSFPLFDWCQSIVSSESKTRTLLNEADITYKIFDASPIARYKSNVIGAMEIKGYFKDKEKEKALIDTITFLCIPSTSTDVDISSQGMHEAAGFLHGQGPKGHIYIDNANNKMRVQTLPKGQ